MSPKGSCIGALGPQLVMQFWGGGRHEEGMWDVENGPRGFWLSTSSGPAVCFLVCQDVNK